MRADRIESLDGLRAIAILTVCAFHYLARCSPPLHDVSYYPFGSLFASRPGVGYGHYGVQLFFVISGFVIAMTLRRCVGLREFAVRRYARLAPAMVVFSVVTFVAMKLIPGSPFDSTVPSFASSLLFVDPDLLNRLVASQPFSSMDGVYWSLYVEVQFYAVASLAYFICRQRFGAAMASLSVTAVLLSLVQVPVATATAKLLLFPQYFPWFLLGIGFNQAIFLRRYSEGMALLLLGLGEIAILAIAAREAEPFVIALLICVLFASPFYVPFVRNALSIRPLVAIGAASYGLYLLHQYFGVALLNALPAALFSSPVPATIAVLLVLGLCIAVAQLSFHRLETPITKVLLARLMRHVVKRPATAAGGEPT